MKKYKDAESLFDDVEGQEEKENMTVAGTSQNENVPAPIGENQRLVLTIWRKSYKYSGILTDSRSRTKKFWSLWKGL